MTDLPTELPIPDDIYKSPQACGEFIFSLNERLAQASKIEKLLKQAKSTAEQVMLEQLNASGQKNFNFEGLGVFKKLPQTHINFPPEEKGGKDAAIQWLEQVIEVGLIEPSELLYLQQNRLVKDSVISIEHQVEEYNKKQLLLGGAELPPSPFSRYETTKLSSPKTRKA